MSGEDNISGILKLIFFLLIFAGGIASDVIKKNKAKRKAEEEEREEEAKPPAATSTPPPQPYKPPAPKKPAPKPAVKPTAVRRTDDSEWLATLADQKRREAAKALAKLDAFEPDAHTADGTQEPPPFAALLTLSAQQAKEGFVLSEILGPPVSMR